MRFRAFFQASRASSIEAPSRRFRKRWYSQPQRKDERHPSFGVAFDIDGVLLRGHDPVGGAPRALRRLYDDEGKLKIPYVFLTNGGGVPESKRASELSELFRVKISPLQVVQGHTPFRDLVRRMENDLIVAVGKGEPDVVMLEYGFRKVIKLDDYVPYFKDIDPLSQYKTWGIKDGYKSGTFQELNHQFDVYSEAVRGVFVVSDPVDWGREIQVLCDLLGYAGLPIKGKGQQPPLYFASDDLEFKGAFPSKRLGMGAFRIALESVFNRTHSAPLEYTAYGKPNTFVFKNAEAILNQVALSIYDYQESPMRAIKGAQFSTLYMIGDNPSVDVKGATKAGDPWFSILTRTGVFNDGDNHKEFPADKVVDTVEDAVDFILSRELQ